MTYTLPFIHKYRFIIAILLTALVSTSMIAFKMTSPAQAATPEVKHQASNYIVPVLYSTSPTTSAALNNSITKPPSLFGVITATGKLTFPRSLVTTTPAPKKEEPVVKKTEAAKPDPASASTAADNSTGIPSPTKTRQQAAAQAPAPATAATQSPSTNSTPAPVSTAPMSGTSPAAAQAFARSYLAGKGLGDSEFQCLVTLWNHESGWNFQATNSSSGAYGIPQSLPGSKMASVGADWQTNPQTQIIWGVGYITGRYGTPCGAVASWNVKGWY